MTLSGRQLVWRLLADSIWASGHDAAPTGRTHERFRPEARLSSVPLNPKGRPHMVLFRRGCGISRPIGDFLTKMGFPDRSEPELEIAAAKPGYLNKRSLQKSNFVGEIVSNGLRLDKNIKYFHGVAEFVWLVGEMWDFPTALAESRSVAS